MEFVDRKDHKNGGVAILIHNDLSCMPRLDL